MDKYSVLKSIFTMSTYFSNDLPPYSCIYLALSLHQTSWDNIFCLEAALLLGFCNSEAPHWVFEHLPYLPSSLRWISGAFHVHWDFFFDMGSTHLFFRGPLSRRLIFAFPVTSWMQDGERWGRNRYQQREVAESTTAPLPPFSLSFISVMRILAILQRNLWGRIL